MHTTDNIFIRILSLIVFQFLKLLYKHFVTFILHPDTTINTSGIEPTGTINTISITRDKYYVLYI